MIAQMQTAPLLTTEDSSVVIPEDPQDGSIEGSRLSDVSFMQPPEPSTDSPAKDEPMDNDYSPEQPVKAGPGRKSRACNEW